MGVFFSDRFSLLHFATGIIAYYWSLTFVQWFVIHVVYEVIENTTWGMKLINNITIWPGGKSKSDTITNQIGDQFYAMIGWILSYFICRVSI